MKLRILCENEQVVDNAAPINQNTSNNLSFLYAYEMIRNKVNNFLTTAVDYINGFLFNGKHIINDFSRNTVISDDMTNIFADTKVIVWVYTSKVLNAFTFPGVSINSSFFARLSAIIPTFMIQGLGIFIILISALFESQKYLNILKSIPQGTQYLKYDPINKKYTMAIKEVTVFISSGLIEGLNDNEVKAILLHEVGHNTMIIANILYQILYSTFAGISILELINIFTRIFITESSKKEKLVNPIDSTPSTGIIFGGQKPKLQNLIGLKDDSWYNKVYFIYYSLFQFFLIYIVVSFVVSYFRRRQEVYADEFAIKCGYGEYLESAISKMKQHHYNLFSKPLIKLNIFDWILVMTGRLASKITNIISMFKFGDYPDINARIDMIHRKTEKFDNFDQNIDRSKHIETFVI